MQGIFRYFFLLFPLLAVQLTEATLSFTEDVRVVTPAGITVATFAVKPGKTVEVQADFSGMYSVHTLDGKYTKKVTVKK